MGPSWLLVAVVVSVLQLGVFAAPAGHLQPFGEHRSPEPGPPVYERLLSPEEFWERHIVPQIPAIFRGAAKAYPAYKLWNDDYLLSRYGELEVRMEQKNESEMVAAVPHRATIREYYNKWQDNGYVISQLPTPMAHEVYTLPAMHCGPIRDEVVEANFWLSSGSTHSQVHKDSFNQFNCLFRGSKVWRFMDPTMAPFMALQKESMDPVYARSGSSNIDPYSVDMFEYPDVAKVRYQQHTLRGGDCLYLPGGYLHQVVSLEGRSLAVSILFGGHSAIHRYVGSPAIHFNSSWCSGAQPQSPRVKSRSEMTPSQLAAEEADTEHGTDGGVGREAPGYDDVEEKRKRDTKEYVVPPYGNLTDVVIAWDYPGKGPFTMGVSSPKLGRITAQGAFEHYPSGKIPKKAYIRWFEKFLDNMLGDDQRFYKDDVYGVTGMLSLLMPHRKQEDFKVFPRVVPGLSNVVELPNLKKDAINASVVRFSAWLDRINPNSTHVWVANVTNDGVKSFIDGFAGWFYLQNPTSSFLPNMGDLGDDDEDDNEEEEDEENDDDDERRDGRDTTRRAGTSKEGNGQQQDDDSAGVGAHDDNWGDDAVPVGQQWEQVGVDDPATASGAHDEL